MMMMMMICSRGGRDVNVVEGTAVGAVGWEAFRALGFSGCSGLGGL